MRKYLISLGVLTLFVAVALPVFAKPDSAQGQKNQCTTIQSGELHGSDGSLLETGYNEWGYNYQAMMFNGMWCNYHPVYRPDGDYNEWCEANLGDVELMMKWNDAWLSNKDCDGDGLLDRYYGFDSYIGSGAWLTNHERGTYKNLIGDWVISVDYNGNKYVHDMTITDMDEDFNLFGYGGYPSGETYTKTWNLQNSYLWGDDVYLELAYEGSTYVATLEGTINTDGSISGEWSSNTGQDGEWETTSGTVAVCDYNTFVKIVAAPADAYVEDGYWYSADGTEIGEVIWGAFAITQEVSNDSCAGEHGLLYKSPYGTGLGFYTP